MAVKFFEGITGARGFLAIKNRQVAQLSDVNLSYSVSTDEIATFDMNFVKAYEPTWAGWTADASFVADDVATGHGVYTGGTSGSTISGTTNGFVLFESMKSRQKVNFSCRLESGNIQRGTCIITNVDIKASAGGKVTGSVKLQGSGTLNKGTT